MTRRKLLGEFYWLPDPYYAHNILVENWEPMFEGWEYPVSRKFSESYIKDDWEWDTKISTRVQEFLINKGIAVKRKRLLQIQNFLEI